MPKRFCINANKLLCIFLLIVAKRKAITSLSFTSDYPFMTFALETYADNNFYIGDG